MFVVGCQRIIDRNVKIGPRPIKTFAAFRTVIFVPTRRRAKICRPNKRVPDRLPLMVEHERYINVIASAVKCVLKSIFLLLYKLRRATKEKVLSPKGWVNNRSIFGSEERSVFTKAV